MRLNQPSLRQLKQRIGLRCSLARARPGRKRRPTSRRACGSPAAMAVRLFTPDAVADDPRPVARHPAHDQRHLRQRAGIGLRARSRAGRPRRGARGLRATSTSPTPTPSMPDRATSHHDTTGGRTRSARRIDSEHRARLWRALAHAPATSPQSRIADSGRDRACACRVPASDIARARGCRSGRRRPRTRVASAVTGSRGPSAPRLAPAAPACSAAIQGRADRLAYRSGAGRQAGRHRRVSSGAARSNTASSPRRCTTRRTERGIQVVMTASCAARRRQEPDRRQPRADAQRVVSPPRAADRRRPAPADGPAHLRHPADQRPGRGPQGRATTGRWPLTAVSRAAVRAAGGPARSGSAERPDVGAHAPSDARRRASAFDWVIIDTPPVSAAARRQPAGGVRRRRAAGRARRQGAVPAGQAHGRHASATSASSAS